MLCTCCFEERFHDNYAAKWDALSLLLGKENHSTCISNSQNSCEPFFASSRELRLVETTELIVHCQAIPVQEDLQVRARIC